MTWLDPNGAGSQGQNLDTEVAWLVVAPGPALTPLQLGEIFALFRRHKAIVAAGIIGYVTRDYRLQDGTLVNVQSNSGIHQVTAYPTRTPPGSRLPHGFLVVADWSTPLIYGRSGDTWGVRTLDVPQGKEDVIVDNYVIDAPANEVPLLVPLVRQQKGLWANRYYEAHEFGAGELTVPVNLTLPDLTRTTEVHTAIDNKIYGDDGTLLYTMVDTAAILASNPEQIHYEPGITDTVGGAMVLQSWRRAVLSDTAQIEQFRTCAEILHRKDSAIYEQLDRSVADLVVQPFGNSALTTVTGSGGTLDGDAPDVTTLKYISQHNTSATGYGSGRTIEWVTTYPEIQGTVASTTGQATFDKKTQVNGDGSSVDRIIAVPTEAGFDYLAWSSRLNYPDTTYWRAGTNRITAAYSGLPNAPLACWQTDYYQIQRIDAKHDRICRPKVWLNPQWTPTREFVIFEGTGEGHLNGVVKYDTRSDTCNGGGLGFVDNSNYILTALDFSTSTGNWDVDSANARMAPMNARFNELAKPHNDAGGAITVVVVMQDVNTPLTGNLHYDYTSRHIIDFDARSQFYAAISVEVQCSGATWVEDTTGERGHLVAQNPPSYTVTISFEWCWAAETHRQVLAQATCTRPGFEFEVLQHFNVYKWPNDVQPTTYYMPPTIAPPGDAAAQLAAVMGQQGTNLHYAGADVLQNGGDSKSEQGIEYSVDEDGVLRGASKWVPGMLYARTFKLADLGDALWLLSATKCDAAQNNDTSGTLPPWYYMPDLGTLIANHTFHVEIRDGVAVRWSDDVPSATEAPIPLEDVRANLSIFRV